MVGVLKKENQTKQNHKKRKTNKKTNKQKQKKKQTKKKRKENMFIFKCSFWTIYFKGHKEAFSQTFQIPHQFNLLQEYLVLMISANSEMTTYRKSPEP
jgi:anaerobic C4-dicarboxylate transporter